MTGDNDDSGRPRCHEIGIEVGTLDRGPADAITDVPGVRVGHTTRIEGHPDAGDDPIVRTGVTAVLPAAGLDEHFINAGSHVTNGYGTAVGLSKVEDLGVIEMPIVLTNTVDVWRVADVLHERYSRFEPDVFNPVVGECYDGSLSDVQGRHVTEGDVVNAIESADTDVTMEGNVGAGTGTTGFGWKAGIGTAARVAPTDDGEYTVGALVQTNTGQPRDLRMGGFPIGRFVQPPNDADDTGGSIMMLVGTDAPLEPLQLERVAKRSALGLGRVGGIAHHTSGDFSIAFSNETDAPALPNDALSPIYRATVEATEAAILNSILRAETMTGIDGRTRYGFPVERIPEIIPSELLS